VRSGLFRRHVDDIRAVDGVDLEIYAGESFGLVGESGSGKTTLGKLILRLIESTSGQVLFEGRDVLRLSEREMRGYRAHMQIVFQDPFSSLNPRMKVKQIIAEPMIIHGIARGAELEARARELARLVGLTEDHLHRFPHEFNGGQRQRIGIARALALQPRLIILDEPTSALDVSVQAQILNLLIDLQKRLNLTYLVISHDLGVIRYMCDRVALMYLGRIMELGRVEQIFDAPQHPYTQALLSAMPEPDPDHQKEQIVLQGEISTLAGRTQGCPFAPRCPAQKISACTEREPLLLDTGHDHLVACHLRPQGTKDEGQRTNDE
jgi:oligopeptide/dipeptide ABC transporter ATP-binding protein